MFPNLHLPVDMCIAPSLDRNVETGPGQLGNSYIYTTPQSTCSGRVVGYWVCYRSVGSTGDGSVRIGTALVLQDRGQNLRIIENFEVEAKPREDNCLSEIRCCVMRRLNDSFEVDLRLHVYGLVIPGRPNAPVMVQTHDSTGFGYQFNSILYDPESNNDMLMKQTLGTASNQPVKMFQFLLIGKFRIRSRNHLPIPDHIFICAFPDNSTSNTPFTDDTVLTTPTAGSAGPTFTDAPLTNGTGPTFTDTPLTSGTVLTTPDTDTTSSSAPPTLSVFLTVSYLLSMALHCTPLH